MPTLPKVPRKFKLFGETINVIFKDNLLMRKDRFGESDYRHNEIIIESKLANNEIKEAVFYHEIVHMILSKMEEHDLCENEKFVNTLGQLINQALKTMEY